MSISCRLSECPMASQNRPSSGPPDRPTAQKSGTTTHPGLNQPKQPQPTDPSQHFTQTLDTIPTLL